VPQYNSQQYDETQFEEDNIDNNEVYENVDRPSASRDLHADTLPHHFSSNAAQSRFLPAAAVPVQRAPMRAATPLPMTTNVTSQSSRLPYGIHSHPLLNVMKVIDHLYSTSTQ
jgi:hypothetical protein